MKAVSATAAAILQALIRFYQIAAGPLFPRVCRFEPTCSTYALQAIGAHGPVRGLWLSAGRILRCHPFHPGGYDPVPVDHTCQLQNPEAKVNCAPPAVSRNPRERKLNE